VFFYLHRRLLELEIALAGQDTGFVSNLYTHNLRKISREPSNTPPIKIELNQSSAHTPVDPPLQNTVSVSRTTPNTSQVPACQLQAQVQLQPSLQSAQQQAQSMEHNNVPSPQLIHTESASTRSNADDEKQLQNQIKNLEMQVESLNQKLAAALASNNELKKQIVLQCAHCKYQDHNPATTGSVCVYHNGKWVIEKRHVEEFQQLPEELKNNLRAEKLKRLRAVEHEMRWIPVDDTEANAPGKWSCCSADKYFDKGCSQQDLHQWIPIKPINVRL
jgi:hypothetical protein